MNKTDAFIHEIDGICDIPPRVRQRMKLALLDYLGVTMAGAAAQGEKLEALVRVSEVAEGDAPALGMGRRMALKDAVFFNGLNAHALDYDDGSNTGIIHLGSPAFSVLLPLAQQRGIEGKKVLEAAARAYEAAFTIARSIQPGHKALGYHATGTCGVPGIALGVAALLGFTEQQKKDAFSAACVSATGMLKVLDDGSELKPFNVAKAALMGLVAAQMGQAGFRGPQDVLAGDRGFLKMMTGDAETPLLGPCEGGVFAAERSYIKPYASCRYCHPSIEAAISIRGRLGAGIGGIEKIEVRTYYWAVNNHDHTDIQGPASAKMSIPYGVALGLVRGRAGLEEYQEGCVRDEEVLSVARRVAVFADDGLTAAFPQKTTAIVTVATAEGEYTARVDTPKGEPENPMGAGEVEEKFISLARYSGKTEGEARKIIAAVDDFENNSGALYALL